MQTKGNLLNSFQMRLIVVSFRYLTHINVKYLPQSIYCKVTSRQFLFCHSEYIYVMLAQCISCVQRMFVYFLDVMTYAYNLSRPS
jgi:hypothetical protein